MFEIYPDNPCLSCNYRTTCKLRGKGTNRPACQDGTASDADIHQMVSELIDNNS